MPRLMEEQIYAFLAGGIVGGILLFVALILLGASGSDPDEW